MKDNNRFRYLLQTAIDLYAHTQERSIDSVLEEMNGQLGYRHDSMTIQDWLQKSTIPSSAEVAYLAKKLTEVTFLDKKWARHLFDAAGYTVPDAFEEGPMYDLSGDFRGATIQISNLRNKPADIFISYARSDIHTVKDIYDTLLIRKHRPWMDVLSLTGGEDWLRAIYKAIDECQIFLAILSNNSVSRRGVIQKELKKALNKWEGMLPDDIYIIPVRVDNCPIPDLLSHIQVLDWKDGSGENKLLEAISVGLARRQGE